MAPKKDPKKDKQAVPELATKYQKREPLPPPEQPDASEAGGNWKALRNAFATPLPEWDDRAVNTTEWKPGETAALFSSRDFSAKALPKAFSQAIGVWRRAPAVIDPAAEDQEPPEAQAPFAEMDAPPEPDPKAKAKAKADAKAKAKAKGKAEPDSGEPPGTAQQFADVTYEGPATVVTLQEFRTRDFSLVHDEALPPICQSLAAQMCIVGDHRQVIPNGCYLWELIHPQDADGRPLFNPHGKYIVRLFVMGKWRQVLIDDVVPVGAASGQQQAPLLPSNVLPQSIWPQLLAKALLRVFQLDLKLGAFPAVTALTGWLPYQLPLSWDSLQASHGTRYFNCLQLTSEASSAEARQREVVAAVANTQAESSPSAAAGAAGAAGAAPAVAAVKLAGPAVEAPVEFLVCEFEADPAQLRIKAGAWRPAGGNDQKTVAKDGESEGEEGDEDAQPREGDQMEAESEPEEQDLDEDDDERRSAWSPSGGEGLDSARSGKPDTEAPTEPKPAEAGDVADEGVDEHWTPPWKETAPSPPILNSVMQEHHRDLDGGYWVDFEAVRKTCDTFVTYMPPSAKVVSASLDSTWRGGRDGPLELPAQRLLRIKLKAASSKSMPASARKDKAPQGRPWHRAIIVYEPLRADPSTLASKDASAGQGASSVLLQSISQLQPSKPDKGAPEYIHLTAGEPPLSGVATKSVLIPSGEHWYLIFDDATKAGSVLSVHIEGTHLNIMDSAVEFLEPGEALTQKGVPTLALEQNEYPAHAGFRIWAKAELELGETVAQRVNAMQLLSLVPDPELQPHLQLTFLKLVQQEGSEAEARCASWSVETLVRAPLLRIMELPLSSAAPEAATKYIVMLEATLAQPVPAGKFSMQLMLPDYINLRSAQPVEELIKTATLRTDTVLRWSGTVAMNDKGIALRERLTVPPGQGDVTGLLRVAASGLDGAVFQATLVAQLPPSEETRPRNPDGSSPQPRAPGAPMDPKDYGGRKNWLARCKTVATATGTEVVVFPHVVLCEASTYILYVQVDGQRGSGLAEGGEWLLELIGSGPVEAGADTMEEDLEELVRNSWVDPYQEPGKTRQEMAKESREKWLSKRAEAEPKLSGEAPEEDDAATEVADDMAAVAQRNVLSQAHANDAIRDFVNLHLRVPPVLDVEDPYVVVLDPPLGAPEAQEGGAPESDPEYRARWAFGMAGSAVEHKKELQASVEAWKVVEEKMKKKQDENMTRLGEMSTWQDECYQEGLNSKNKVMEARGKLREAYETRFDKLSHLREVVRDGERTDAALIRSCIEEGRGAGVAVWDAELLDKAELKLRFLEGLAAFREGVAAAEADPASVQHGEGDEAAAAARSALAQRSEESRRLWAEMKERRVRVAADVGIQELLEKAAEFLKEPQADDGSAEN